ncbi:DUF2798 domain-containing protein [Marinomonas sp.]|nr:DUF2798 domain-containing protein [Marinomonas sp.]MDB4838075.1 DUF2798 domain-containing protein [Marinomonas sp.]
MTKVIYTTLFSCTLSCIMSAWVTYINIGLTANFLSKWHVAFLNAWPAAFICAYLLGPMISKITAYLMKTIQRLGGGNA